MRSEQKPYLERLLKEQDRIRQMIQLEEGERIELSLSNDEGDEADRSLTANLREFNITRVDFDRQRLRLVEEAIERLEDGEYGDCRHCGEPIAPKRLEAVPWAQYCINCQALKEQGRLEEEVA